MTQQIPLAPDLFNILMGRIRDNALADLERERLAKVPCLSIVPRPPGNQHIVMPAALAQALMTRSSP